MVEECPTEPLCFLFSCSRRCAAELLTVCGISYRSQAKSIMSRCARLLFSPGQTSASPLFSEAIFFSPSIFIFIMSATENCVHHAPVGAPVIFDMYWVFGIRLKHDTLLLIHFSSSVASLYFFFR